MREPGGVERMADTGGHDPSGDRESRDTAGDVAARPRVDGLTRARARARPSPQDAGGMTRRVKIGDRWIGDGEPVFVISEAGSNHDKNLDTARRLVDAAADAGA